MFLPLGWTISPFTTHAELHMPRFENVPLGTFCTNEFLSPSGEYLATIYVHKLPSLLETAFPMPRNAVDFHTS